MLVSSLLNNVNTDLQPSNIKLQKITKVHMQFSKMRKKKKKNINKIYY